MLGRAVVLFSLLLPLSESAYIRGKGLFPDLSDFSATPEVADQTKDAHKDQVRRVESSASCQDFDSCPIRGWAFFMKVPTRHDQLDRILELSCVDTLHPFGPGVFACYHCTDECASSLVSKQLVLAAKRLTAGMKVDEDVLKKMEMDGVQKWRVELKHGEDGATWVENQMTSGPFSLQERTDVSMKAEKGSKYVIVTSNSAQTRQQLVSMKAEKGSKYVIVTSNSAQTRQQLLSDLVTQSHVMMVEPFLPVQLANYDASIIVSGAPPPSSTSRDSMGSIGIKGDGEVVSVGDTGLDVSNCYFYDPDEQVRVNVYNGNNRKVVLYRTLSSSNSGGDARGGHGTHVTGTVLGNVLDNITASQYSEVMEDNNGVAENAKVAFIDLQDESTTDDKSSLEIPASLSEGYFPLFYNEPVNARISSNSWGSSSSAYSTNARDVDTFVVNNDDMVAVFAAGNEGRAGSKTVNTPGTCKNCITVGASLNTYESFEPLFEYSSSPPHNGYVGMTVTSSNGEISGLYNVTMATFGNHGFDNPLRADVVVASPLDACTSLDTSSIDYTGKMVLVERGTCTFVTKGVKVENAGGIGMLLVDSSDSTRAVTMGSSIGDSTPQIYACSISKEKGKELEAALSSGYSLNITYPILRPYFNRNLVAAFSSRGPTNDLRIKPDVIAPGEYVYSSFADGSMTSVPTASTCTPNSALRYEKGTSMATPVTAGSAALLRQYFKDGYYNPGHPSVNGSPLLPQAALIKAMMVATAAPLVGAVDEGSAANALTALTGAGFGRIDGNNSIEQVAAQTALEREQVVAGSFIQGFGRLDFGHTLTTAFQSGRGLYVSQSGRVATGEKSETCFDIEHDGPFKVALVWTDQPGTVNSYSVLVNDLDLEVVSEYATWLGNGRTTPDERNNVESVYVGEAKGGTTMKVVVKGGNVPFGPQSFALVAVGNFSSDTSCAASTFCPSSCNGRGTCVEGVCECEEGYTGTSCAEVITTLSATDEHVLARNVAPEAWLFFRFEVSDTLLQTLSGLQLDFARTSGRGDPDYYLRRGALPSLSEFDSSDVECDTCSGGQTSGRLSVPNVAGTYYFGVYGYCCDAASIEVALSNSTVLDPCEVLGCAPTPSSSPTPSPTPAPENTASVVSVALIITGGVVVVAVAAFAIVQVVVQRRRRRRVPAIMQRTVPVVQLNAVNLHRGSHSSGGSDDPLRTLPTDAL
eukprot:CAMPEP_0113908806 /NCGR_PEP_ID=MMETSP0780_2-20120614/26414_1 /TAXON_ID=652834 /ORGANISM="Palpitomonas bilix" /LENGTH=1203 /DNA_ID=CAMNT_0000904371 /DNA_START=25 /DNA_END=3636 /DNA_ORIENTATION=- /assembly_acc=CAM_ASM_000599